MLHTIIITLILLFSPFAIWADEPGSPTPPATPSTPIEVQDSRFYDEFTHMLSTLAIIIILILIVSWVLKKLLNTRIQQINNTSAIKILERRSLNPKSTIYLLEIRGKELVIAESPAGISFLNEVRSGKTSFNEILEEKQKDAT